MWYAVWLSVHAALAGVPAKMARDRADSDGFPANAAAAVVGGPARGRACRGERVGAAPGERARRAVVVGVVVAVAEWCAAGGLAWFPWIWGGFGPVLGRNPASATGMGRWGRGKVRMGDFRRPAFGSAVPSEKAPAPAAGPRGRGTRVWGIYPLEATPLGRRKARISKHAASQHFDCSPR